MDIVFRMMPDGGFVAGDRDSEMTSYAYPSSPHAIVAKRYPKLVAEEMLASERSDYRKIPAIADYDAANWRKIAGTSETPDAPKNEEWDGGDGMPRPLGSWMEDDPIVTGKNGYKMRQSDKEVQS